MRKALLIAFIAVSLIPAVSLAKPYTLIPWPYGVLVLVQTPSINQQQFSDEATQAAESVFSFWDLPIPAPDPDWATPKQTSSEAWSNAWLSAVTQTPSLASGDMDRLAPGYGVHYKTNGTPFPLSDSDELLIVPAPT